jgi:hypothetical protein
MYEALEDINVDEQPIVGLACGHVMTIGSLDGVCGMRFVYSRADPEEGPWTLVKDLKGVELPRPKCPSCRCPITNIKRCGRVLNLISLQTAQRKYLFATRALAQKGLKSIGSMEDSFWNRGGLAATTYRKLERMSAKFGEDIKNFHSENPYGRIFQIDSTLSARNPADAMEPSVQSLILLEKTQVQCLRLQICCKLKGKESTEAENLSVAQNFLEQALSLLHRLEERCLASKSKKSFDGAQKERCILYLHALRAMTELKDADTFRKELVGVLGKEMEKLPKDEDNDSIREEHEYWKKVVSGLSVEEKKLIFKAMESDIGGGIGSFGGHWYECSNGHPFTIGECGGAMEESKCPECGERIGGQNHRLNSTNAVARGLLAEIGHVDLIPEYPDDRYK